MHRKSITWCYTHSLHSVFCVCIVLQIFPKQCRKSAFRDLLINLLQVCGIDTYKDMDRYTKMSKGNTCTLYINSYMPFQVLFWRFTVHKRKTPSQEAISSMYKIWCSSYIYRLKALDPAYLTKTCLLEHLVQLMMILLYEFRHFFDYTKLSFGEAIFLQLPAFASLLKLFPLWPDSCPQLTQFVPGIRKWWLPQFFSVNLKELFGEFFVISNLNHFVEIFLEKCHRLTLRKVIYEKKTYQQTL